MAMKIRKGDTVVVIAGRRQGQGTGACCRVDEEKRARHRREGELRQAAHEAAPCRRSGRHPREGGAGPSVERAAVGREERDAALASASGRCRTARASACRGSAARSSRRVERHGGRQEEGSEARDAKAPKAAKSERRRRPRRAPARATREGGAGRRPSEAPSRSRAPKGAIGKPAWRRTTRTRCDPL